jgi:hypothetical protein
MAIVPFLRTARMVVLCGLKPYESLMTLLSSLEKSRLRRFFRTLPPFAAATGVAFAACAGA